MSSTTPTERPAARKRTPATDADDRPSVEDTMLRAASALWLVKSVVDNQHADIADFNPDAWWALSDLLETAASDLDAAHGRYCTESNALHAAAEAGAARRPGAGGVARGRSLTIE